MKQGNSPLSGYRVLDLTSRGGWLSGRILADLGAEVIKVEPPGGDPGRKTGSFLGSGEDPEQNLFWLAFNLGKKGITLKLDDSDGRDIFLKLASDADIILESFPVGYMTELKLDYEALRSVQPGIIYTSISPFGQNGPYQDYKGSDIVAMAMGGFMYLTGDPDRAPLRLSFPLSDVLASMQAALGSLIAMWSRHRNGQGQYVDVSAQESVVATLGNAIPNFEFYNRLFRRSGQMFFRGRPTSDIQPRLLWPCQDGVVSLLIMGGDFGMRSNQALADWIARDGIADDFLQSVDWKKFDMSTVSQEFMDRIEKPIERFFLSRTKSELAEGAAKRGIPLQPVDTFREVARSEQLASRGFWKDILHLELGTSITYAGPFAQFSESPLIPGPRGPQVGEHNKEVYGDRLGKSQAELIDLGARGVI